MKRVDMASLSCNFWKQSFPMLPFISHFCRCRGDSWPQSSYLRKIYNSNNELNSFSCLFSSWWIVFVCYSSIQEDHLPFYSSCDKGLSEQFSTAAGQQNRENNTALSGGTGIPLELQKCLAALARGVSRKIV